jgi:hypothetical protein
LSDEEIATMDYLAVCKAIRSIQSKKTHTRYADDCLRDSNGLFIPGSGAKYKEACRIEELLKARRDEVKPEDPSIVFLSDVLEYIEHLDANGFSVDEKYDKLVDFLKGGE